MQYLKRQNGYNHAGELLFNRPHAHSPGSAPSWPSRRRWRRESRRSAGENAKLTRDCVPSSGLLARYTSEKRSETCISRESSVNQRLKHGKPLTCISAVSLAGYGGFLVRLGRERRAASCRRNQRSSPLAQTTEVEKPSGFSTTIASARHCTFTYHTDIKQRKRERRSIDACSLGQGGTRATLERAELSPTT